METETETEFVSFVQIRGSMPFFWEQFPNHKGVPKCTISSKKQASFKSFQKHFSFLKNSYKNIVCVNLVDKKGDQNQLGTNYEQFFQDLPSNDYAKDLIWFDYHHECKNMKVENCFKLIKSIKGHIKDFQSFCFSVNLNQEIQIKQLQKGVIRMNCMDCLDRTNVVQTFVARHFLLKYFEREQLLISKLENEYLQSFPNDFEQQFRYIWFNHGNSISVLYSGTGAIKTDFTLTGKRTIKGKIQDICTSTKR